MTSSTGRTPPPAWAPGGRWPRASSRPASCARRWPPCSRPRSLLGLGLIHWGGPWMLAIGVASIICGIAYTGGPWPLGYHGLGDLFVFVFFGLVAVDDDLFRAGGRSRPTPCWRPSPIGLLAANILLVNNYRDVETDAAAAQANPGRALRPALCAGPVRASRSASPSPCRSLFGRRLRPVVPPAPPRGSRWPGRTSAGSRAGAHARGTTWRSSGDTGKLLALYAALFAAGVLSELRQPRRNQTCGGELRLQRRLGQHPDDLLDHLAALEEEHGRESRGCRTRRRSPRSRRC